MVGTCAGEITFVQLATALKKTGKAVDGEGNTIGWAARDDSGHLSPYKFTRRAVGDDDIAIQIAFAGICHSDLHQIKNEWGNSSFPMVPGCAYPCSCGWLHCLGRPNPQMGYCKCRHC